MAEKSTNGKKGANDADRINIFAIAMEMLCEMRAICDMPPMPFQERRKEIPIWRKKIYDNFRRTLLKPILKLRPSKKKINWRNVGRCLGLIDRQLTFWEHDFPNLLKKIGLTKLSKAQEKKLQEILGEAEMREHLLKCAGRSMSDKISTSKLLEELEARQSVILEKARQSICDHLARQPAKVVSLFYKGIAEGYSFFINEDGEFCADDRRASIHMELLAWQNDIEKMRKSIPQKRNKDLIVELQKLPEFKTRKEDWFKDVFKDIKLSIGVPGRPWGSKAA